MKKIINYIFVHRNIDEPIQCSFLHTNFEKDVMKQPVTAHPKLGPFRHVIFPQIEDIIYLQFNFMEHTHQKKGK